MRRKGLTITELSVVLAIILILAALSFPAIQASRETARRIHCASNMRQIAISAHRYEEANEVLVPMCGRDLGWLALLTPYHEIGSPIPVGFSLRDLAPPAYPVFVSVFTCPSDSTTRIALGPGYKATSYAGNAGTGWRWHGHNGMFQYPVYMQPIPSKDKPDHGHHDGPLFLSDVTDGTGQTAMVTEILASDGSDHLLRANWHTRGAYFGLGDYETFAQVCEGQAYLISPNSGKVVGNRFERGRPWWDGWTGSTLYNHFLPPNRPSCTNGNMISDGAYTAASLHPGGVNVAYADGHVAFVTDAIDRIVWRALGSRDGGDNVTD